MDAWERFRNSIKGDAIDRTPLALIGTNRFYASLWNVNLFEVLHDPQLMIDLQTKTFRKFPQVTFVPGVWPDYGVGILSAFGCQITWQKDTMPQVTTEILQNDEDIAKLKTPDPFRDGFMPWYLQTLSMFLKQGESTGSHSHFIWSFGPGELACYLWGTCRFLADLIQKQELMFFLLDKVTQSIIVWLEAQQKINPSADAILFTDDISGLMSDQLYKKCLMPFQQKIVRAFPNHIVVFHNDTKSNHILPSIKELGIHVFNLGKTTSLEQATDIFKNDVSIMGNLDPLELLTRGSKEEIIAESLSCIAKVKNNPRFILSAGGGMNDGTTAASIEALIEAVEKNKSM